MVKKFLDELAVKYEVRNVLTDRRAAEEFRALGGRLPPLVLIDGKKFEGFRPAEIEAALGLRRL